MPLKAALLPPSAMLASVDLAWPGSSGQVMRGHFWQALQKLGAWQPAQASYNDTAD